MTKKIKCPSCGHIQDKEAREVKDALTKSFIKFFEEQLDCGFTHLVECKNCKINYVQEQCEVSDDKEDE